MRSEKPRNEREAEVAQGGEAGVEPRARRGRDQEAGRRARGGGAAVQLEEDLGVEQEN